MGNAELKNLPRSDLKALLQGLPLKPGVYLFKDHRGEVLYVGQAKNLKNRVKTYFQNGRDLEPRLEVMRSNIADLDYIVVSTEVESLILENNLIKQYQPRFNVRMRDDKNYQFIKIDYSVEIPQVYTVRKIEKEKRPLPPSAPSLGLGRDGERSKYFGPYTSGLSVKQTLHLLKHIFHLCRHKKVGAKACFAYHLGRCPGVCAGKISAAEYRKTFAQIEEFLKHRQTAVLKRLKTEMREAAKIRKFEKAARARDKIRALEHLWQRQKIVSPKNESRDYLGIYRASREAVICLFLVREGKMIHTEYFELRHQNAPNPEIFERFILEYYDAASDLPREIILPEKLPLLAGIEKILERISGRRIKIQIPRRGKKLGLLKLAAENAALYYERERSSFEKNVSGVLKELQTIFNLPNIPKRIEGYDISNIQGTNPVGSMVVFTDGKSDKSQYRKFKINIKDTPDDFAMMKEMLERRFRHHSSVIPSTPVILNAAKRNEESLYNQHSDNSSGQALRYSEESRDSSESTPQNDKWKAPDLIVIDGGQGQLNVAIQTLQKYNLKIPLMGLAKPSSLPLAPQGRGIKGEGEKIFIPGKKDSIILKADNPVLFLLQRIRDEAHRFAITFYRGRHLESQSRSRLDDIPGVGPVTRKKLLQKFSALSAIRRASLAAVAAEVGIKTAKKIKEHI